MKFNVSNIEPRLAEGLKTLSNYFDFSLCDCGINITAAKGDSLAEKFEALAARNDYNTVVNEFYAALCHCLALVEFRH